MHISVFDIGISIMAPRTADVLLRDGTRNVSKTLVILALSINCSTTGLTL